MADVLIDNGYFGEQSWRAAVQLIKDALVNVATPDQVEAALEAQKTEIMKELNALKEEIKTEVVDGKGEAGGLAGLDEEGRVPVEQLPVGEENGVAPLDETGKIPSQYLPSYVDDVVEGTLGEDGVFMTVPDPDVAGDVARVITGERGKIYVDVNTNWSYRWSGHMYVKIESNDLVELTAEDVKHIWDTITANKN